MALRFEWDNKKNDANQKKHGISFEEAKTAFDDPLRMIARDTAHGQREKRFYCFGVVGKGILTVRFTIRERNVRIIGAGYWRKGKKAYEQKRRKD